MAPHCPVDTILAMSTPFAVAYPPGRGPLGLVFKPVFDIRSYLRFAHLALMMPLGVAYFTFFVTAFSFGGSLIWTFIGPPVIFVAMYISLRLGDLEVWMVNFVTRAGIRRPQQALEGVTSFRQKVWARIIDPSTWTGLVYEFAQFPVGVAAFVAVLVGLGTSFYLIVAPIIVLISDEPIEFLASGPLHFDSWVEALVLVPFGMLGWVVSVHILTAFSAIHAGWAKLMLGSRARHLPSAVAPATLEPETPPPPPPPIALLPPPEAPTATAAEAEVEDYGAEPDSIDPAWLSLTSREREVTLLLARGFSNADISEHCFISEGTVKTHVLHILEKLNAKDRTQVVIYAYEHGLVKPGGVQDALGPRVLDRELIAVAKPRG
jgi:DNA-binding CsgD family transcriptional regulator